MASLIRSLPLGRISLFGLFQLDHDEVKTPGYEELEIKSSGFAGVKQIFSTDEYGSLSPQLATATHMSCLCILGGMMFGGFHNGKNAWINFMENNQATQFINHMDAKRKLQDIVTQAVGKGALKWGYKIGAFTTICIFSNTIIAAYRGGPGFLEYLLSGALTGALFKANMGLRGAAAGTVVGAACGSVAGMASYSLLWVTGFSMEEVQETQYKLHSLRDEQIRIAKKQHYKEELMSLRDEATQSTRTLDDSETI